MDEKFNAYGDVKVEKRNPTNLYNQGFSNNLIDYVLMPIGLDLDVVTALRNVKRLWKAYAHDRKAMRKDMEKAGVFDSLDRIEAEGTSLEKLWEEDASAAELARFINNFTENFVFPEEPGDQPLRTKYNPDDSLIRDINKSF